VVVVFTSKIHKINESKWADGTSSSLVGTWKDNGK